MSIDWNTMHSVLGHLYGGIGWANCRLPNDRVELLKVIFSALESESVLELGKISLVRHFAPLLKETCQHLAKLEGREDFQTIIGVYPEEIIEWLESEGGFN